MVMVASNHNMCYYINIKNIKEKYMKNTTKKILAGACLGLVGLGCLTGCDMSSEDMSKWEQKADAVIEKLDNTNETTKESNILLEQQLSKLSKQEAYDFFIKKGHIEKADNVLAVNNLTVSLYEFD